MRFKLATVRPAFSSSKKVESRSGSRQVSWLMGHPAFPAFPAQPGQWRDGVAVANYSDGIASDSHGLPFYSLPPKHAHPGFETPAAINGSYEKR